LLAVTVLDLKPNPQDTSAFYLENIYKLQLHADTNPSQPPTEVTPPPFSPQNYVIIVNTLWFLSLTIGLTSAMLALMLQQWARYLRDAQNLGHTPHDTARIHAFFARGVDRLGFSWVSDVMTFLIHTSLFLFFTGLLIYLFNINRTIFYFVVGWIAVAATVYLIITISPMVWADSPYYSPFSSWTFRIYGWLLYPVSFSKRLRDHAAKYSLGFSKGIEKMAAEFVSKNSSTFDSLILNWMLDAHVLTSGEELGQFFNDIHDFYGSKIVSDSHDILATLNPMKFSSVSVAFMKRTFSLPSPLDPNIMNQFKTCLKVADLANSLGLLDLFSHTEYRKAVQTIDVGKSLSQNARDGKMGSLAQTIIADILVTVSAEDGGDDWIELAAKQLGESEDAIRENYCQNRNNLLLANWNLIATQILNASPSAKSAIAQYMLPSLSGFNIQDTLPELKDRFCEMWNEIIERAKTGDSTDGGVHHFMLFLVSKSFYTLHGPTLFNRWVDPSRYPLCAGPLTHVQSLSDGSPSHHVSVLLGPTAP
jgi:Family of unknown function (DUF6535)